MKLIDQHMHCDASFDCKEPYTNYLNNNVKQIIFTDHFDLNNPISNNEDDIPDLEKLQRYQKEAKEIYNTELLIGIEVGYVKSRISDILKHLSSYNYDSTILSVHHNNKCDFMDHDITKISNDPIYEYLNLLIDAVKDVESATILAHIDYGFRIHNISSEILNVYKEQIVNILSNIISKNIALERNTKSMYKYDNLFIYEFVIDHYIAMGGKDFTLGFDAHKQEDMFYCFENAIQLLKSYNVNHIVEFKQGKKIIINI